MEGLTRLCEVLDCQPGDLLTWRKDDGQALLARGGTTPRTPPGPTR